jgi:hypothetical protein
MRHLAGFPVLIMFLLGLAGCDDFSLLGLFSRGGPLGLALQASAVHQGQTINLYPSGGSPPYTFSLIAQNLYYTGTTIGTVSNQAYTAGDAIGSVEIVVTDNAGGSANSVVSIVPPTPGSFTATADTVSKTITLSWSYGNTAMISGFQIWQSANGGAYALAASPGSSATSYTTGTLNQNWIFSYQVYAVAGSLLSLPTPVQSAQP